ncbi:hypothetical protein Bca52824_034335 [Brassica carinata]|uniref:Uncharacterized protein n=1 Tax=Brassica carinata TaxID=52824 RepID=A0A8X7RYJ1_BRACI|nr:hypothetical protein Bca52824_034335 [Brassica carinata]
MQHYKNLASSDLRDPNRKTKHHSYFEQRLCLFSLDHGQITPPNAKTKGIRINHKVLLWVCSAVPSTCKDYGEETHGCSSYGLIVKVHCFTVVFCYLPTCLTYILHYCFKDSDAYGEDLETDDSLYL